MGVCNYLNQRVRRIGVWNGEYFKGVTRRGKKKKIDEEIEFHSSSLSFITHNSRLSFYQSYLLIQD